MTEVLRVLSPEERVKTRASGSACGHCKNYMFCSVHGLQCRYGFPLCMLPCEDYDECFVATWGLNVKVRPKRVRSYYNSVSSLFRRIGVNVRGDYGFIFKYNPYYGFSVCVVAITSVEHLNVSEYIVHHTKLFELEVANGSL